jgi:hypothetical protein
VVCQVSKLFNLEEVLDELSTQGSCNKDEQGGERMVVADSAAQDSQAPQGGKVRGYKAGARLHVQA